MGRKNYTSFSKHDKNFEEVSADGDSLDNWEENNDQVIVTETVTMKNNSFVKRKDGVNSGKIQVIDDSEVISGGNYGDVTGHAEFSSSNNNGGETYYQSGSGSALLKEELSRYENERSSKNRNKGKNRGGSSKVVTETVTYSSSGNGRANGYSEPVVVSKIVSEEITEDNYGSGAGQGNDGHITESYTFSTQNGGGDLQES